MKNPNFIKNRNFDQKSIFFSNYSSKIENFSKKSTNFGQKSKLGVNNRVDEIRLIFFYLRKYIFFIILCLRKYTNYKISNYMLDFFADIVTLLQQAANS